MLEQLRFARISSQSLATDGRFASEIVGLELVEATENVERFRSDDRYYALELDASGATDRPVIGVSLRYVEQLAEIAPRLHERGWSVEDVPEALCSKRRYKSALACRDLSGNAIELVVRSHNCGQRYFPSRDAGIVGLSHVAMGSRTIAADARVWIDVLGARVADWVGESVQLGWDDRHHRLTLVPSARESFLALTFEVESIDSIMQSRYLLEQRQVRIVRGPGREPSSGEVFLTFESPTKDFYYSYVTAPDPQLPNALPRQFDASPSSHCIWGSESTLPEFGGAA
ncbi:hypothetical protein GCM10011371_34710 [Novosphingobium marinum]|uniref:2,3-dihydroxy-p-cumate/2,3-dihydroxybenzoate 3,4-dioxygenase n=1 Tax=Novosphingobium marinum TaxID=1514948 RepID=A0A7Z0BX89_9SPHN|nr:oxidoreductase [Novosphingobium marinum]NYH97175.1 2,3-dihydroxy-p-cumate/2,3-dihydroxybenzoate 3,4-dioxygenase [Novosphingobium marinum]GGC44334.1 hypothetical protein GCM10011371_34710 [Novosphingobium marinum]